MTPTPTQETNDDYSVLKAFVTKHMSNYDASHDAIHAQTVFDNCLRIIEMDSLQVNMKVIAYAAYLHDVRDHKYVNEATVTEQELDAFIDANLSPYEALCVKRIIANVSFSKEVSEKGLDSFDDDEKCKLWRDIVSDADKLEVLGERGIRRCEIYSAAKTNDANILAHMREKLLRLLPEGFIKTTAGRKLAVPGHQILQEYYIKKSSEL